MGMGDSPVRSGMRTPRTSPNKTPGLIRREHLWAIQHKDKQSEGPHGISLRLSEQLLRKYQNLILYELGIHSASSPSQLLLLIGCFVRVLSCYRAPSGFRPFGRPTRLKQLGSGALIPHSPSKNFILVVSFDMPMIRSSRTIKTSRYHGITSPSCKTPQASDPH